MSKRVTDMNSYDYEDRLLETNDDDTIIRAVPV